MDISYQVIINLIAQYLAVAFPIAIIFMFFQKIVGIFINFVFGKEITF